MLGRLFTRTLFLFCFFFPSAAFAHFVWIISEDGVAKVYFGESLQPDQAEFLHGISSSELYRWNGSRFNSMKYELKSDSKLGWFESSNPNDQALALNCDYGVVTRGEQSRRLNYSARFQESGMVTSPCAQLRFDVRTTVEDGKLKIETVFDGLPAADTEVVVAFPGDEGAALTLKTDLHGCAELKLIPSNHVLIRGKKTLADVGELNGKKYSEHLYYCTVALKIEARAAGIVKSAEEAENATVDLTAVPNLPVAITSFGAAKVGDSVFVFGGQMGEAHSYARNWQNGKLYELDTSESTPEWRSISERQGIQGLAFVSHDRRLYRIGGFEARNAEGDENDLHSLDSFEAYDTRTGEWAALPSLPSPRSSMDACVIDGKIYVVGGWTMCGAEPPAWCESALVFDLADPNAKWQDLPAPPFKRRALSLIGSQDRLYAIGGIGDDGKTSSAVDIYDLETRSWRSGVSLPECGSLKGFGSCAFEVGNSVVVSVSNGQFFRWDEMEKQWLPLKQELNPGRFFHRVIPMGGKAVLVISGANMEIGKFDSLEILKLE